MTVRDTTGAGSPAARRPATLPALTTRHATLGDLAALLSAQQATRYDVVTPAAALRAETGTLLLDGAGPVTLGPDGVTTEPGRFRPTGVCDNAIAEAGSRTCSGGPTASLGTRPRGAIQPASTLRGTRR